MKRRPEDQVLLPVRARKNNQLVLSASCRSRIQRSDQQREKDITQRQKSTSAAFESPERNLSADFEHSLKVVACKTTEPMSGHRFRAEPMFRGLETGHRFPNPQAVLHTAHQVSSWFLDSSAAQVLNRIVLKICFSQTAANQPLPTSPSL
jgi:hypothetical protein